MTEPLSKRVKASIAITTTNGAAGTSAINSAIIDMAGFEAVQFVIVFGAIVTGAVNSIKVQQDDDSAGGTMEDITGTAQTIADNADDKVFFCDLIRPAKRYVRMVVSRATQNATVGSCLALQYDPHEAPVTQGTNVTGELHIDKIAGTA